MEESLSIVGIDPGVSGAIAIMEWDMYTDKWTVTVHDMPTYTVVGKNKKKRRWCDAECIGRLLAHVDERTERTLVYCEHVHAMPMNGSIASFSLGHSLGTIQACCAALHIDCELVSPQRWKDHFNLVRKPKAKSVEIARTLFPQIDLSRAKDDGKAEALLIGQYGAYAMGRDFSE